MAPITRHVSGMSIPDDLRGDEEHNDAMDECEQSDQAGDLPGDGLKR